MSCLGEMVIEEKTRELKRILKIGKRLYCNPIFYMRKLLKRRGSEV